MTYELHIGDYAYSSWSLRGWLLFKRFGIDCTLHTLSFSQGPVPDQIPDMFPARTVPAVRAPDGSIWTDSLVVAEELASRHRTAGHWPDTTVARAIARNLCAEMHSGFGALRSECPMNVRLAFEGVVPGAGVLADLQRLEEIWRHARATCAPSGPWLCGDYSAADAFFAPVAARIAGYGLPVSQAAADYVNAHLADALFNQWCQLGRTTGPDLARYAMPYATKAWPTAINPNANRAH